MSEKSATRTQNRLLENFDFCVGNTVHALHAMFLCSIVIRLLCIVVYSHITLSVSDRRCANLEILEKTIIVAPAAG